MLSIFAVAKKAELVLEMRVVALGETADLFFGIALVDLTAQSTNDIFPF